jgi:hypothetical protein
MNPGLSWRNGTHIGVSPGELFSNIPLAWMREAAERAECAVTFANIYGERFFNSRLLASS